MFLRKITAAVFLLSGLLLPASALAAQAYVTGNVNVRSGPGTGYARLATLPAGARVNIRTCRGNWCNISRARLRGWVSANYLDRIYAQRPHVVAPIIVHPPHYRPHRPRPPHYRPPHHRPPHVRPPRPGGNCRIAPGFPCPR